MNPAFSVIFLTTLIGVGQGLFIALLSVQGYTTAQFLPAQGDQFYIVGSAIAMVFLILGLFASFFHLGHPERAWRAASMWRTSWLSREVIVLPMFMGAVVVYGVLHYIDLGGQTTVLEQSMTNKDIITLAVGIGGVVACFALFICTGMIYACLKFLQEWHSPLTVINYTILGMASGFTLASLYASYIESELLHFITGWAITLTIVGFITRIASLMRNHRIKYKSNLQTAIGVRHTNIQQKAMGAMGGSFNTREFFHNKKATFIKSIKWIFLLMVFIIPIILLVIGYQQKTLSLFWAAFISQYIGLLAERWFFFAQARHPQNLYYQTI